MSSGVLDDYIASYCDSELTAKLPPIDTTLLPVCDEKSVSEDYEIKSSPVLIEDVQTETESRTIQHEERGLQRKERLSSDYCGSIDSKPKEKQSVKRRHTDMINVSEETSSFSRKEKKQSAACDIEGMHLNHKPFLIFNN